MVHIPAFSFYVHAMKGNYMKKNNPKIKCVLAFLLAFCMLCALIGCTEKAPVSNQQLAEEFLVTVLNMPAPEIAAVATQYPLDGTEASLEKYTTKIEEIVPSVWGAYVAESMLDPSSNFYAHTVSEHCGAANAKYSYTATDIEVTEVNEKQFTYTAIITASNQEKPFKMTGSVQFDDEHLVNHISMREGKPIS